ncbi:ras-related and estrogen-regulated growth inhibitor [Bombyx mori]|uniref:small monomeric GTPase n=1 Tax=Bombyx mori TaxID=7091 RepID=A0A8R1WKW7_BOMMO|nr:ras-related and estrogen-regulated growth inhibitor isoform X2 [Bombyx mori]
MASDMAVSTSTSPKSSLAKLVLYPKPKAFKIAILGQSGVGKSALVVRFITRRFIGEYDSNLEKIYAFQTVIDNEMVYFEILDSAGDSGDGEYANLESNIRWAEAFILMYSVTDKCSFDECHRLKFLINYNKRRRRLASSIKDTALETPVVLVGNKIDQLGDRMISTEEGQRRSKEIGCVCFHEISVRESIDQVWSVFRDARRFWRVSNKWFRPRGDTDVHTTALSRPLARASSDTTPETNVNPPFYRQWTAMELDEEEEATVVRSNSTSSSGQSDCLEEFRARASTDSRLPPRPARPRHPRPTRPFPPLVRRMSVAMRGNNANTY